MKKYGIFSRVLLKNFSGQEILYNTVVCVTFVQKKKKLGKRKTGVLKRMLIRDPVDLHFVSSNIK